MKNLTLGETGKPLKRKPAPLCSNTTFSTAWDREKETPLRLRSGSSFIYVVFTPLKHFCFLSGSYFL